MPAFHSLAFLQGQLVKFADSNNKESLEQGKDVGVKIWCERGLDVHHWKVEIESLLTLLKGALRECVIYKMAFKWQEQVLPRSIQTCKVAFYLKQISTFDNLWQKPSKPSSPGKKAKETVVIATLSSDGRKRISMNLTSNISSSYDFMCALGLTIHLYFPQKSSIIAEIIYQCVT